MRLALLSALILVTAPAFASETPTQEPTAPAKPKKICKSEQLTTSRMPVRVCKTAAEWGAKEELDAEKLKHLNPNNPR
jgi:hypothetical protein